MRPRNLKLAGFTCFRDEIEIDFTGMDVFVIAGPTGAGKTTIVDALCYALFGRVPRGTNASDLIARDASAMKVQLEFESGGRRYRVHRGINVTRTTGKRTGGEKVTRAPSPVQFEEWDHDAWQPLQDRVADVNAAIEQAVGLDFDAFTKCVLLPQGRFAEFLTGKPEERRKILVELLGIGVYNRIMQSANARAATLATQIGERENQLVRDFAGATEEALAAARESLATARPLLDAERQRRDALQHATGHVGTFVRARRDEANGKATLDEKQVEMREARLAATDGAKTLAEYEAALADAERALADISYDAALLAALVRADACARQAARAREAADVAHTAAADRASLDAAERETVDAEAAHAAARDAVAAAEDEVRTAQHADAALHLRSGLKPGDPCPVCGGTVGKLPKAEKSPAALAERALKDARAAEAAAATAASSAATAHARAQQAHEAATAAAATAARESERAEQELRDALPAGVSPDPAGITRRLDDQERARAAHDELAANVERVRHALDEHRQRIAVADRRSAALTAEIAQLEAAIATDRAEGDAALAQLKDIATAWQWGDVLELIAARKSPATLLESMLAASQRDNDDLTRRIATLEADIKTIEHAIARAAELRDELAAMKDRHRLCHDLGVLLRADNFQQYVILEAMQVLAEAATAHLRTLFDRFGIRVARSDFVVVDHWQADHERPARTLSGGETFVASLALALALAERLPELRSAAASSLESLFLDEGFGTLDAETLDTVIDALESLRSQERMVGVITHVPELTDRIQHKIIVSKSPSGSTITTPAGP